MSKINHIGPLFAARLCGIFGVIIGLFSGIFYSFGGAVYDLVHGGFTAGTAMAFGALIGMPAIFALTGAACGLVGSFFYNLYLKRYPGIRVDIEAE